MKPRSDTQSFSLASTWFGNISKEVNGVCWCNNSSSPFSNSRLSKFHCTAHLLGGVSGPNSAPSPFTLTIPLFPISTNCLYTSCLRFPELDKTEKSSLETAKSWKLTASCSNEHDPGSESTKKSDLKSNPNKEASSTTGGQPMNPSTGFLLWREDTEKLLLWESQSQSWQRKRLSFEQWIEAGSALQLSQICDLTCLRDRVFEEWICWSHSKQSLAESALQYKIAAFELQNSHGRNKKQSFFCLEFKHFSIIIKKKKRGKNISLKTL